MDNNMDNIWILDNICMDIDIGQYTKLDIGNIYIWLLCMYVCMYVYILNGCYEPGTPFESFEVFYPETTQESM